MEPFAVLYTALANPCLSNVGALVINDPNLPILSTAPEIELPKLPVIGVNVGRSGISSREGISNTPYTRGLAFASINPIGLSEVKIVPREVIIWSELLLSYANLPSLSGSYNDLSLKILESYFNAAFLDGLGPGSKTAKASNNVWNSNERSIVNGCLYKLKLVSLPPLRKVIDANDPRTV